jgi:predicted DCC family thiol-disulfide oxidoreductase YuxK
MMEHAHFGKAHTVVLYDGVCGLCNRLVQFLLKRDQRDVFRFAPLQSRFAKRVLARHGVHTTDLDTLYVIADCGLPSERLLSRSAATLYAAQKTGGMWKMAVLGRVLPGFLRDAAYDLVARYRYRIFGKYETCLVPEERYRGKFLDVG